VLAAETPRAQLSQAPVDPLRAIALRAEATTEVDLLRLQTARS
jgi:hypothetical protein